MAEQPRAQGEPFALLDWLWYRRSEGAVARLLLAPLWLVSLLFGLGARLRLRRHGRPGAAHKAKVRVVSIGNVTVGGAGKTPVVIHLARRLQARGRRVAVLSRGYRRADASSAVVVSSGEQILEPVERAGDEPLLIARACPGVAVLVGPDRAALADQAVSTLGAQVLLLDDGMQHVRLHRDLDLAVVDASNPFGNGHLLPRGPLREPRAALRRAGLAWLSKVDQADPSEVERLAAELEELTGSAPVRAAYRLRALEALAGGRLPAEALAGRNVLLLAGLARPGSFRKTVTAAGARVSGEALFPDHHRFTSAELAAVTARARQLGAEAVVLTEKDAVRLPADAASVFGGLPGWVVGVDVDIRAGEEVLARVIEGAVG